MHGRREDEAFDAFVTRSLILILGTLAEIRNQQEQIMSAQDNAAAALAVVVDSIGKLDSAVQIAVADLIAAKNAGNDAAFQLIADKLTTLSSTIAKDTADLTAAESPTPAPAPAPAPSPDPAPVPDPAAPATA